MLVNGVGINDADYLVEYRKDGKRVRCPAYRAWSNMIARCYGGAHIAYSECRVDSAWLSFMTFRLWWLSNYKVGYDLDKDILHPGNKVYGADKCLYIPKWLNTFINAQDNNRGNLPIGVSMRGGYKQKPYLAQCKYNGKTVYLGVYTTPEEAHAKWLRFKLDIIDSRKQELDGVYPNLSGIVRAKILSLR